MNVAEQDTHANEVPGESEAIPIGSMIPLTGGSSAEGLEFRNGFELALDEINSQGGILGRRLRPFYVDTGSQSAAEVVKAATYLISKHRVHAIINGYNIGPQNSEYEPIADAGIIYIHHNTLLQHHDTVLSDPNRYFGCFMADPAEFWYGHGLIKFLSWLRDTGQWKPDNNRIAIISGSTPYSIVIANAIKAAADDFGWTVASGPEIVKTPTTEWRRALAKARSVNPAVIANTHFYAGDLAHFQLQFMENPSNSLVYVQYAGMHRSFREIAGPMSEGVIVGTVVGCLLDKIGRDFSRRYNERFGESASPLIGALSYAALHHYAIAASLAGGTGAPGNFDQNLKIARRLKETIYRSVLGVINFHPLWQSAIPYPDATDDPSLGMPHLFFQIQDHNLEGVLIAPEPYNNGRFRAPPWMT